MNDVAEPARVLIVDDEEPIRRALERTLTALGHSVVAVDRGEAALDLIRGGDSFEVTLLDVRMPGMNGTEVVTEALDIDPDLAILMLSGMNDATTAAICMQRGAMDYLIKPIEITELRDALARARRRRDTNMQGREISSWLRSEVAERTKELGEERRKLRDLNVATLEALVNAQEAKDPFLSGHSMRVAALSATIAHEMGLSDDEVEAVRTAGRLHDLGKIGVREAVLNKTGTLTDDEYEEVKQHVTIGSQILAPLFQLGSVIDYVKGHHEKWDGTGYPTGLAGEKIPVGARIIAGAEIYDALTTERSYQAAMTPDEATARMEALSGSAIDPTVLDALKAVVQRRQTLIFIEEETAAAHDVS